MSNVTLQIGGRAYTDRLRRTLKAHAPWDTAGSTGKAAGQRRK